MLLLTILACGLWLSFAAAYPRSLVFPRGTALPPSQDPFYKIPANISDYKPGDIINSRPVPQPVGLLHFQVNLAAAYQVLYRTTGPGNVSTATATTVMIPHNANFKKVLSYQAEMDTPFDEGFTSYVIQFDQQKLGNFLGRYGILWFVSMLSKGWVVCSPDYEGPDGLFVNGIMSGRATLDGIRAVLRSKRSTGVEKDAKVALWGYSGGSLATEFALELQGSYAPDLDKNIIVAASGGLPVDAAGVIKRLSGKLGAGLAMSGILGISKSTPQLRQYFLDSFVSKGKRDEFLPFEKSLAIPTVLRNLYRDVFGYFKDGEKFFEADVVQAVLRENKMGSYGTPKVPYYVYHAVKDEVLPEADAKALIQSHCNNGAKIKYVREAFGEHVIVGLTGAAGAAKFLIDHMDGRGTQPGCDVESVVSSLLNPAAAASLTDIVFNEILAILRLPLGK